MTTHVSMEPGQPMFALVSEHGVTLGGPEVITSELKAAHYGEDADPHAVLYATRQGQPGLHPLSVQTVSLGADESDFLRFSTTVRYADRTVAESMRWSVDGRS